MPSSAEQSVTALVATKDRHDLLLRAIRSIAYQSLLPSSLVVVNDGAALPPGLLRHAAMVANPITVDVLPNTRAGGAAGAWNSGLDHIACKRSWGFVAFLDDDDEWDSQHVETCTQCASSTGANIVVSGLRRVVDGREAVRELLADVCDRDFLVGNPGWQGSNTFVHLDLLAAVGGFRHGLRSLNDRDLAIRLLRHPNAKVGYTGQWTASWHHRLDGTLSAPRSPEKIAGLRWFWWLYGHEMDAAQQGQFFGRAEDYFKVSRAEIVALGNDLPRERKHRGDWNAPAIR